jgi:hypothetical protein
MRLLYAPGLSDSDARMEALRACMNGSRNDTNGVGAAGTARQHAVRVGNRGGMAVLICTRRPDFNDTAQERFQQRCFLQRGGSIKRRVERAAQIRRSLRG